MTDSPTTIVEAAKQCGPGAIAFAIASDLHRAYGDGASAVVDEVVYQVQMLQRAETLGLPELASQYELNEAEPLPEPIGRGYAVGLFVIGALCAITFAGLSMVDNLAAIISSW